jgi:putative ABC transport system permease protein
MIWNTFKVGVKNLLLHKLRSLLTVLGVILGVGSVISMLAVGEGSKKEALERIRQLGANNVIVRSVKPTESSSSGGRRRNSESSQREVLEYGLTYDDLRRFEATLPTISLAVPVSLLTTEASNRHRRMPNARVLGTTPEFLSIKNLSVEQGRFITEVDLYKTWNIAVLAAGAAERLFSFEDPIGKSILIGPDVYRVVGVLADQATGTATPGGVGQKNYNRDIYIPLSCSQRRFGDLQEIRSTGSRSFESTELHEITLSVVDSERVSQTASMVRSLLERAHPKGNDYEIQVPLELLAQAEEEKRIWNIVLGCIAGISLLVGGIGIMNIMLASVTERTREIGIRRALGAKRFDITLQFLIETVLLSSVGGVLGVLFGILVPLLVTYYANLETEVSLWSVFLAFGISVGIGIIFGIYPARRAAMMDPIEALRHE